MKLAIGLITMIFGVLLVMYGILNNAAYFIVSGGKTSGMLPMMPVPTPEFIILVGAVLIVVGCVVFERGIKEK